VTSVDADNLGKITDERCKNLLPWLLDRRTLFLMVRWVALTLGSALLGRGNLLLSVLFFAGGAVVFYVVSLQLHPRRVCRACGGTGRHRGAMFWWGDRACTRCGGAPRHRRWGVQMLYGGPGRRTRAEQAAKDAGRRRGVLR
jgi:hypothetical protein